MTLADSALGIDAASFFVQIKAFDRKLNQDAF